MKNEQNPTNQTENCVNFNLPEINQGLKLGKKLLIMKAVRYYSSKSSSRKRYFYNVTYMCQTLDDFT